MKAAMWLLLCGAVYLNSVIAVAAEEPADAGREKIVEILNQWQAAADRIDFLDVSVQTFEYNQIFYTEKRGVWRFVWARPNRGLISIKPAKIDAAAVSSRKDPEGKPFELSPADPSMWYWDGDSVLQIDERFKTYQSLAIPKETAASPKISTDPKKWLEKLIGNRFFMLLAPQNVWPMVVDIRAEQMLKDYHWSRLKGKKENTIYLSAVPKNKRERQEYHRIVVMLDAKTFRTRATKITDPTGNTQRVFVFDDPKTEPDRPWEPDLSGYKKIGNQN